MTFAARIAGSRVLFASFLAASSFAPAFGSDFAERHAPIFVSKDAPDSETNSPLLLAYSVKDTAGGVRTIRYTAYFSGEDSVRSSKHAEKRMLRYGRRLDVRWAYEVRIDSSDGKTLDRSYHCRGVGRDRCPFRGEFQEGTERPILYVARRNAFRDRPGAGGSNRRIDLSPEVEIPFPQSRDLVPLARPELLFESDRRLEREGKLAHPATEYLYLRVRGKLRGKIRPYLIDTIGLRFPKNPKRSGALREMGLDLWGRESVVAIWLPPETIREVRLGIGEFRIAYESSPKARLELEEVGAYTLEATGGGYRSIDLSERVRCVDPRDLGTCRL